MGVSGAAARMAFDTAMAVGTCGPPITVMPTASKRRSGKQAARGIDEFAVDVAVDDVRAVAVLLERGREAQHGQRKARAALRGDGRIDEQEVASHDSFCAGHSQRMTCISIGKR